MNCYTSFIPVYRGFKCIYATSVTKTFTDADNDFKARTENTGGLLETKENETLTTMIPIIPSMHLYFHNLCQRIVTFSS